MKGHCTLLVITLALACGCKRRPAPPPVSGDYKVGVGYQHLGEAAENDAAIADPVCRKLRAKLSELRHIETRSTTAGVGITLVYPTNTPDLSALQNALSDVRYLLPPATSLPTISTVELLVEPDPEKPDEIVVAVKGADRAAREQRAHEVMNELQKIGGTWNPIPAVVRIDDDAVTELQGHDVSAVRIKEVVGAASDVSVRFH